MFLFKRIVISIIGSLFFLTVPFVQAMDIPTDSEGNYDPSKDPLMQEYIDELYNIGYEKVLNDPKATPEQKAQAQAQKEVHEFNLQRINSEINPKTPIPSLFAEGGGCTFDQGSGTVSCKAGILGSACEVVMAGLRSEKNTGGKVDPKSLTCTEFVDPLPARFMNGYKDGGTYCIQQTEIASGGSSEDNVNTYKFTNEYGANTYCIGLLHKTGDGDLTPILGFVMFIYNLMQPLLIIGGVIALVVAGIFIMYAPGGEGDTIKKGKEMLIRIISGFLLFFMIKVFLSTINGNFFSSTPTGPSTSTESSAPAGASTESFTGDAVTSPQG